MLKPAQMSPFHVGEQRFYSESLLSDRAPHLISKGVSSHSLKETNFHLYPRTNYLGHYPELRTIGEGGNADWQSTKQRPDTEATSEANARYSIHKNYEQRAALVESNN